MPVLVLSNIPWLVSFSAVEIICLIIPQSANTNRPYGPIRIYSATANCSYGNSSRIFSVNSTFEPNHYSNFFYIRPVRNCCYKYLTYFSVLLARLWSRARYTKRLRDISASLTRIESFAQNVQTRQISLWTKCTAGVY